MEVDASGSVDSVVEQCVAVFNEVFESCLASQVILVLILSVFFCRLCFFRRVWRRRCVVPEDMPPATPCLIGKKVEFAIICRNILHLSVVSCQ